MKITLIGSAKFEKAFHDWNKYYTLSGCVVYSLGVFPSNEGKKNWYTEDEKETLDLVHLKKIIESDAVMVITHPDWDGQASKQTAYIGESTRKEIKWAKINGLNVYYCYQYPKGMGPL